VLGLAEAGSLLQQTACTARRLFQAADLGLHEHCKSHIELGVTFPLNAKNPMEFDQILLELLDVHDRSVVAAH